MNKKVKTLIESEDDFVQKNYRTNWTNDDMCEFAEWCGKNNFRYNHPSNSWMDGNYGFLLTQTLLTLFIESKTITTS